jgi:2-dehydro-3-deoxyphosphooctonate aldolase (KDO 8-P synthase)
MTVHSGGAFAGLRGARGAQRPFLIAGPCVLEDHDVHLRIAEALRQVSDRYDVPVMFKASFDKANRTSIGSERGPGRESGCEALARIRDETGFPVLTDIHLPCQAESVSEVVDALQIPAFLSRQTDLLVAAGATGLPVNVKKGQWMAPEHISHAVEKLRTAGAHDIAVTERGTAFGYGRWIVDMRSFGLMRRAAGCPTIFDATHSVQLPGGGATSSAGEPEHIEPLAAAAMAAGADGLFVEVHPDPARAPSDGANMLALERLDGLVAMCVRVWEAIR